MKALTSFYWILKLNSLNLKTRISNDSESLKVNNSLIISDSIKMIFDVHYTPDDL